MLTAFLLAAATANPPSGVESIQVTATRSARGQSAVAQAVSVVDPDAIQRGPPQSLPELLRGVPGVFVQQTTPGQGVAIIRGLKGSEVLHLVDGMRLNHAFFRNAPNQYLALVDPLATERIEVVRGASPGLYGADAMGGVVNILSWRPRLSAEAEPVRGSLRSAWSSASQARSGRVQLQQAGPGLAVGGGLSYQQFDGRTAGGGDRLPHSGYSSTAADLHIHHRVARTVEWHGDVSWLRQPGTPRHDQLVTGFGQAEADRSEFEFEPSERRFAHLTLALNDVPAIAGRARIHLAQQDIIDASRRRRLNSRDRDLEDNRTRLQSLAFEAETTPGHGATLLTWGGELWSDRVSSERLRVNLDSGDRQSRASRFPDDSTMQALALHAQWEQSVARGTDIVVGGRASRIRIRLPGDGERPAARLDLDDVTGNLGLRQDIAAGLALVANLGRGYRPPNIFDLGALGPRPGGRFNAPNRDLGPEYVISSDLGLKFASQSHYAELFAFHHDYRDKIASVLTGEQTADGEAIVQSRNVNRVELYGLEAAWSASFGRRWTIECVLDWVHGVEISPGGGRQPADRIPPARIHLRVEHEARPGIRVAASLDSARRQSRLSDRDLQDARINPAGTPGNTVIGFSAQWAARPDLQINLHLDNVLDRRFRPHASGIDAAGIDLGLTVNWDFVL